MKNLKCILATLLTLVIFAQNSFARGLSEDNISEEVNPDLEQQIHIKRTQNLVEMVESYLRENDAYVAVISRRGAGDPETGVSDTDKLDLTGMAHSGFVIRNGFSKNSGYITFNLVREKGAKKRANQDYDLSELRVWSLPHFFIGSFEKDAIIFLPEKKVQLKLWNLLRANGSLEIANKKRYLKDNMGNQKVAKNGTPSYLVDKIIVNGAFPLLHNPEYNLLSDFAETSTQNCNEHLLKTYIGFRDHWLPVQKGYDLGDMNPYSLSEFRLTAKRSIEQNYTPRQMVLSRTKSTFAFVQNIRFGERYAKSPQLFGLKLNKEKFDVVSVDSFCNPKNQNFLAWSDFKVFRENHNDAKEWFIEDWGKNYIKVNRHTKQKNRIRVM